MCILGTCTSCLAAFFLDKLQNRDRIVAATVKYLPNYFDLSVFKTNAY